MVKFQVSCYFYMQNVYSVVAIYGSHVINFVDLISNHSGTQKSTSNNA